MRKDDFVEVKQEGEDRANSPNTSLRQNLRVDVDLTCRESFIDEWPRKIEDRRKRWLEV
jgi:hypothetical protein